MVICLERGADLHMAQLMPLPLTISCFSKIQIGLTFLVPAHPGSPGKRAVKRVCVCTSVILIDSSMVSPVYILMLSIQAVRGLPRLHAPAIVPFITSFSRQFPCFLVVRPLTIV